MNFPGWFSRSPTCCRGRSDYFIFSECASRARDEGPLPSCCRARAFRAAPVSELLQSVGFVSFIGALFRKPDGGADLRVGCRPQGPAANDPALSGAYVARYQRAEPATLGHRGPERLALPGNARVQADRQKRLQPSRRPFAIGPERARATHVLQPARDGLSLPGLMTPRGEARTLAPPPPVR